MVKSVQISAVKVLDNEIRIAIDQHPGRGDMLKVTYNLRDQNMAGWGRTLSASLLEYGLDIFYCRSVLVAVQWGYQKI